MTSLNHIDLGDTFVDPIMAGMTESKPGRPMIQRPYMGLFSSVPVFLALGNRGTKGWNFDDIFRRPVIAGACGNGFETAVSNRSDSFYSERRSLPQAIGGDTNRVIMPGNGACAFVVLDPFQYSYHGPRKEEHGGEGWMANRGDRWDWTAGINSTSVETLETSDAATNSSFPIMLPGSDDVWAGESRCLFSVGQM
jgi:hypothetical protein